MATNHAAEISRGERFRFGSNWAAFHGTLNDFRVKKARQSLQKMLAVDDLSGKRFLDIGSGSGLFSLAARQLGATVHSFDYDPESVQCTRELKQRYFAGDSRWAVEEGSALDEPFLRSLGKYDVVYAWGVLHHTGNMALALRHAMIPVADEGLLFLSIYNDRGFLSRFWKRMKKLYCSSRFGRIFVCSVFIPVFALRSMFTGVVKFGNPLHQFTDHKNRRGMSLLHDWIDWFGGYPFEVARPEEIFHLYTSHGYTMVNMTTTNGTGCNQFVFQKQRRPN